LSGVSTTREKADPNEIGEVGAPLSGDVIKVKFLRKGKEQTTEIKLQSNQALEE